MFKSRIRHLSTDKYTSFFSRTRQVGVTVGEVQEYRSTGASLST